MKSGGTLSLQAMLGHTGRSVAAPSQSETLFSQGSTITCARFSENATLFDHWVPLSGLYPVGCMALHPSKTSLCVSERRLQVALAVFSWPQKRLVQQLINVARVDVADMRYVPSGEKLAILADAPQCFVALYAVDAGGALTTWLPPTSMLPHPFASLSWAPTSLLRLCVSGSGHAAVLWHDKGDVGMSYKDIAVSKRIACHIFKTEETVVCGTSCGAIVEFRRGGEAPIVFDPCEGFNAEREPISALYLTRMHTIVVLGNTGTLLMCTGSVESSLTTARRIETGMARVGCVAMSAFNDFLVGSSGGSLVRVQIPAYTRMMAHTAFEALPVVIRAVTVGAGGAYIGVCPVREWIVAAVSRAGYLAMINTQSCDVTSMYHVGEGPSVVRSIFSNIAIAFSTGMFRIISPKGEMLFQAKLTETPLQILEVNDGVGHMVVSDGKSIFFLIHDATTGATTHVAHVRVSSVTAMVAMSWLQQGSGILATHQSGDVVCLALPEQTPLTEVIDGGTLFVNSWRIDLPLFSMAVLYQSDETITIFAQSCDKESKLYSLDRTLAPERKDRESKSVRPWMTLSDHTKRGSRLLLQGQYLYSCGTDGKLVVRDASGFRSKGAPTTAVKERREPLASTTFHNPLGNGIADVCVMEGDVGRVITVGFDGLFVIATDKVGMSGGCVTKIPRPSAMVADDTMLYPERVAHDTVQEERRRHAQKRQSTVDRIASLGRTLREIRMFNNGFAEDERVPLKEFLLESQRRAFEEGCAMTVSNMRHQVKQQLTLLDYEADLLRQDCWEVMDIQLRPLYAIAQADLVLRNFTIRKCDPKMTAMARKLKFMRSVEIADRRHRRVHELESLALPRDGPSEEGEGTEGENFLYPPLLVFTRQRAIIQIRLLSERIAEIRGAFNAKFDRLVEAKRGLLELIEERNQRCAKLLRELDEDHAMFVPFKANDEDPAVVFNVRDDNVPADKSTDPEERRRQAQAAAEREKWIQSHGSDEAPERALKLWMDGRLVKDVKPLVVDIVAPEFADEASEKYVAPEDRSDEQIRVFKEYQMLLSKRTEEVTARRKALQEEFAAHQKQNLAAATQFDEQLRALCDERHLCQQKCYEVELNQVKLLQGILIQEERLGTLDRLDEHRRSLVSEHEKAMRAEAAARAELNESTQKLEHARDEEKARDKNIKSYYPFNDGEFGDMLYKMHAKRMKAKGREKRREETPPVSPTGARALETFSLDPYRPTDEHTASKLPEERVERPADMSLSDALWGAYMDFRRERATLEREVLQLQDAVQRKQAAFDVAAEQRASLSKAIDDAAARIEKFRKESLRELYDIDQLFVFRQGQVEVEQAPVVTDYADAMFIHTSVVERLNGLIVASTDEKLEIMREIQRKRGEIALVDWDIEHLQYELKSLEVEYRHLHTLRVTKQMQEFINGGGEDHNAQQREKLQRKIDHVRTAMAAKIEERVRLMHSLKGTVRDKETENILLLEQVTQSKSLVDDRQAIRQLQVSDQDATRSSKIMRDMRVTRRLEDVARAQQDELSTLKREVDRLRERTFPSFAVVSKRVIGNPDQVQQK